MVREGHFGRGESPSAWSAKLFVTPSNAPGGRLQWKVKNSTHPFRCLATRSDKYEFFDCSTDRKAVVDHEYPRHDLARLDALIGEIRESRAVVSHNDAIVFGGPGKHDWIDRAFDPDVLNPNQVQFRKTKQ